MDRFHSVNASLGFVGDLRSSAIESRGSKESSAIQMSWERVVKRGCTVAIAMAGLIIAAFPMHIRAYSDEVHTGGRVCGNPNHPCQAAKWKFENWDISFVLPRELKWLNNYYSADFYAVILKSRRAVPDPDGPAGPAECSGYFSEPERAKTQSLFPNQKVFASHFGCGHLTVGYTNVNYDYDFLAVYGGETLAEANRALASAKGKFAGANVRKMQVVIDYGD